MPSIAQLQQAKTLFDQLDPASMTPDEMAVHGQVKQLFDQQFGYINQRQQKRDALLRAGALPGNRGPVNDPSDTVLGGVKDALGNIVYGMPATAMTAAADMQINHPVLGTLPGVPQAAAAYQAYVKPVAQSAWNQLSRAAGDVKQAASAYRSGDIGGGLAASVRVPARIGAAALAPLGIAGAADASDAMGAETRQPSRAIGNALATNVAAVAAAKGALSPADAAMPKPPGRIRTAITARFPERLIGSVARSDSRAGARAVMARRIGTAGDPGNLPVENFAKNVNDAWNSAGQDVQRVIDSHSATNPNTMVDVAPLIESPYTKRITEVDKFARGDKTAVQQIESLTDQAERRQAAAAEYAGLKPGQNWQPGQPVPMTPAQMHAFTRDWRRSVSGGFDRMEPTEQAVVMNMHDAIKHTVPGSEAAMNDYHALSRYNESLQDSVGALQGDRLEPPLISSMHGMAVRKVAGSAGWKLPVAYGLNEFAPKGYRYVGTHQPAAAPAASVGTLAGGIAAPPVAQAPPEMAAAQEMAAPESVSAPPGATAAAAPPVRPPRQYSQITDSAGNTVPGDVLPGRTTTPQDPVAALRIAIDAARRNGQIDVARQLQGELSRRANATQASARAAARPAVRAPRITIDVPEGVIPTERTAAPQEFISPDATRPSSAVAAIRGGGKITPRRPAALPSATGAARVSESSIDSLPGRVVLAPRELYSGAVKQQEPAPAPPAEVSTAASAPPTPLKRSASNAPKVDQTFTVRGPKAPSQQREAVATTVTQSQSQAAAPAPTPPAPAPAAATRPVQQAAKPVSALSFDELRQLAADSRQAASALRSRGRVADAKRFDAQADRLAAEIGRRKNVPKNAAEALGEQQAPKAAAPTAASATPTLSPPANAVPHADRVAAHPWQHAIGDKISGPRATNSKYSPSIPREQLSGKVTSRFFTGDGRAVYQIDNGRGIVFEDQLKKKDLQTPLQVNQTDFGPAENSGYLENTKPSLVLPTRFKTALSATMASPRKIGATDVAPGGPVEQEDWQGRYLSRPDTVHGLNANTALISRSAGAHWTETLYHELGHAIYEKDLTKQERTAVGKYFDDFAHERVDWGPQTEAAFNGPGQRKVEEFFPELVSMYVTRPSVLKQEAPEGYALVKRIFGGKEYIRK